MKTNYTFGTVLLLLSLLASSCDKKDEEPAPPLDDSSGAPLVGLPCGEFRTFTQSAWDEAANGKNPGNYRDVNFAATFLNARTNGLVIGIVGEPGRGYNFLRFTTAQAVQDFLPQTGTPAPLNTSADDPPAGSNYSEFAGEIAALKLNLYYDDNEHFSTSRRTGQRLRYLYVNGGVFDGLSVESLLRLAERALGGDPATTFSFVDVNGAPRSYTFTLQQLHEATKQVNENFSGGTKNNGFLRCEYR